MSESRPSNVPYNMEQMVGRRGKSRKLQANLIQRALANCFEQQVSGYIRLRSQYYETIYTGPNTLSGPDRLSSVISIFPVFKLTTHTGLSFSLAFSIGFYGSIPQVYDFFSALRSPSRWNLVRDEADLVVNWNREQVDARGPISESRRRLCRARWSKRTWWPSVGDDCAAERVSFELGLLVSFHGVIGCVRITTAHREDWTRYRCTKAALSTLSLIRFSLRRLSAAGHHCDLFQSASEGCVLVVVSAISFHKSNKVFVSLCFGKVFQESGVPSDL